MTGPTGEEDGCAEAVRWLAFVLALLVVIGLVCAGAVVAFGRWLGAAL